MDLSKQVLNWTKNNEAFIKELLFKMVEIKSLNPKFIEDPNDSEVVELQNIIEEFLKGHDVVTDRWDVYPNQPNVVGVLKGESSDNTLILNGHIDVVPSGNISDWNSDPFVPTEKDGKIYGRGTGDMKAGVLSNIIVAKFIKDLKIKLKYDLQFHVVVDEEGGGEGTRAALKRGYTGAGAIITEPSNEEILAVEGGLQWVRVKLKGRAAHAGWRYSHIYPGYEQTGVNVIEKAVSLVNEVSKLERQWSLEKAHPLLPPGITTINPGIIFGGAGEKDGFPAAYKNPAVVPDYCIIDFDLKYLPTEKTSEVKREFEEFISNFSKNDSWLRNNPPEIEWGLYGVSFEPVNTDLNNPMITFLKESRKSINMESKISGMVAVTDAAFYSENNIPSIIYGPITKDIHGPNEYVEWQSVLNVINSLILTVLKWNEIDINQVSSSKEEVTNTL